MTSNLVAVATPAGDGLPLWIFLPLMAIILGLLLFKRIGRK
ncbi:hypothetical protein [Aeromicrobium sp. Root472D3]|nr:hypothetical protein [Aeromicrobium sp. Root472D3]